MNSYSDISADNIWLQIRKDFLRHHSAKNVQGRTGTIKEIRPVTFTLSNPRSRWIVSRVPVLNPAAVLSEVIWILNGRNDSAFVNYWNNNLRKYAGNAETYYGAYGFRMRQGFGIDQLANAADALIANPDSRQVCLSIWDPRLDLPLLNGEPRSQDIPCNICSMLKIRDGKLEWTQIMRSNDFWLGLPFNIVQFTMIQEILASWIGVKVGCYSHLSDSLHVYTKDEDNLAKSNPFKDIPENTDDFTAVNREESISVIQAMTSRLDKIVAGEGNKQFYRHSFPKENWPAAYSNMYRVITAEACRRKGKNSIAKEIMSKCSNPVLNLLWMRWVERIG